jgi:uncharacterized Fe-S cluster-containing MiaB family protein
MIFTRHTIPNALKAAARAVKTLFSKDPVLATPGIQMIREMRCQGCNHELDGQCTLCTCVVSLKTMLATESCPIGRWKKQTRFSNGLKVS